MAIGAIVEIGVAEHMKRARERLEQRFEIRKPAPFGIGDRPPQPVFDSHREWTIWSSGDLVIWSLIGQLQNQ
jgi:hypothetical protein